MDILPFHSLSHQFFSNIILRRKEFVLYNKTLANGKVKHGHEYCNIRQLFSDTVRYINVIMFEIAFCSWIIGAKRSTLLAIGEFICQY